jgi:hypothetical protein
MRRAQFTRTLAWATVLVAVPLIAIVGLFLLELRQTETDLGTVLSAFFSDEVLRDASDSGSGREIQIILLRESLQPGRWAGNWSAFPQASVTTRSSFVLNNVVSRDIRPELRLPSGAESVVVSRTELQNGKQGDFEGRFPSNVGYFAISYPGFNFNKTEAIFYIDHYCQGLCGGGTYILMRNVNGVWHVVAKHSSWVS